MINIDRKPKKIDSLETKEIKEYIDQATDFLNDPKNTQRPKKPVSYRNPDVLKAFDNCFYSKCYLTEQKFPNSRCMDVDHFIPLNERPDLAYSWSNLFPSEHWANMMKPKKTPDGGYLDPTNPEDNVEEDIRYSLSIYGENPAFEAKDPNCVKCKNTANLLNRLHSGYDNESSERTKGLRVVIQKKYIAILKKIISYNQAQNSQEKFQARRELKELLSRKSSYTMLCRSIPEVRKLPDEFFD